MGLSPPRSGWSDRFFAICIRQGSGGCIVSPTSVRIRRSWPWWSDRPLKSVFGKVGPGVEADRLMRFGSDEPRLGSES